MSNSINPSYNNFHICIGTSIDYEYKKIIKKLMQYGLRPTGSKAVDKARLHKKELEQAEKEPCVSNKFLTVTKAEQEKIQAKKKEKRIENNPENFQHTMKGQKLLGEQIMLAIEMKKKKEKKED